MNEINQIRYLLAKSTAIKNYLCIHGIDVSAELKNHAIYLPCLYVQKPDQWKAAMLMIVFKMKYGGDEVPHNLKAYFFLAILLLGLCQAQVSLINSLFHSFCIWK